MRTRDSEHRRVRCSAAVRRRARELRKAMTPAEVALWSSLRGRRLIGLKFRRQHPIGRFIVDFCCPSRRLIVELDGGVHLGQEEHDEDRTRVLGDLGYRVIRFANDEVIADMTAVLEAIVGACEGRPSPTP